jgi:hypothetical protein
VDEEARTENARNKALERKRIELEIAASENKAKTDAAERARLEKFRNDVGGGVDPVEAWKQTYPESYAPLAAKPRDRVTITTTVKELGAKDQADAVAKIDEMNKRYPDYKFALRPEGADPFALAGYKNELAKSANTPADDKKLEVAQKAMAIVNSMKSHPGFKGAVGFKGASQGFGIMKAPVAGSPEAGFNALDASLRSLLTLENLGMLKGVLSDKDMQVLQSAATTLNTNSSEEDYIKALDEIRSRMEKIINGTNQPPVQKQQKQQSAIPTFATEAEAEASGVKGKVIINGRAAEIQ